MSLLCSEAFATAISGESVVLVDAGARGGLGEPWSSVPAGLLRVLAFEPDAGEAARLNAAAPKSIEYVAAALWDVEGEVGLNLAEVPSTSSIYPPDHERLRRYEERHGAPRRTVETLTVPATTLDRVLEDRGLACDFLKVDVQGSELEVLRGGGRALDHVLAAVVETWSVPIHRGQGRVGAVLEELSRHGLDLFDLGVAAAWYRRGAESESLTAKRQITGIDIFVLRDPPPADPISLAKAAAFADAYGFPDVAASFLELSDDPRVIALRAALQPVRRRRLRRLRRRFAPLHE